MDVERRPGAIRDARPDRWIDTNDLDFAPLRRHGRLRRNRSPGRSALMAARGVRWPLAGVLRRRRSAGAGESASLRQVVAGYAEAGARSRRVLLLPFCLGVSGFLEGFALTALIPALNAGFSQGRDVGLLNRLLDITAQTDQNTVVIRSLVAFALLGVTSALATFVAGRLLLSVRFRVESNLRRTMTRALLNTPWLPFLEMRLGNITKATLLDPANVATGLVNLLQGLGATLVALAFIAISLAISVELTAFTLAFGAFAVIAYGSASERAGRHSTELAAATDELSRETTEIFGAFKYVRAGGLTQEAWRRTAALIERCRVMSLRANVPQTVVRLAYEGGGIVFVAAFLAFSLLAASVPIGTALVFLAVFYRLAPRLSVVNDSLYMARMLYPWYEAWRTTYRAARAGTEGARVGGTRPPSFDVVRARSIRFTYPRSARVLSDVNLDIRKGTCTAIVGESGSGKTTLMDIMIGLLQPQSGEVTIEGVPVSEVDPQWWHRQLGLVMQDSVLFSGTVVDNVAIGDPAPDRDRVLRCLSIAAADQFVLAMPEGLDTHVGERGAKLSGGQRQRLALARALYRDPGLLCLDEATAALDAESEALILDAVSRIKRDRAVLMVTHRVRSLTVADRIVVLDKGRVAEAGSWEELTSAPTRFKRLVESQA
jgi:ATP-binding cassette subfamily C protein